MLQFEEMSWLEPYVSHNAAARQSAANAFEKNFYKLLNNSIFGKTMENVRQYRDLRIVVSASQLQKQAKKPSYLRTVRFIEDADFAAVEHRKTRVLLNKPIYVGLAILDLSKSVMYDFHYGVMKPAFGRSLRLLFTDTDSLAYQVTLPGGSHPDAYSMLESVKQHLDTSSFPRWHPLYSAENARVPGKFKDELCDGGRLGIMREFVGLRAKVYAMDILYLDQGFEGAGAGRQVKRLKGLKKDVVKRQVRLEDYRDMIQEAGVVGADARHAQVVLRSRLHQITTERQTKRSLSSYDDKRYVLACGVHTLAYGNVALTDGSLEHGCPFCAESFLAPNGTLDPSLPR